jgi:uncharacterized protein with HEPN domain
LIPADWQQSSKAGGRQGVARNFEIIGEAVKRLAQVAPGSAARMA